MLTPRKDALKPGNCIICTSRPRLLLKPFPYSSAEIMTARFDENSNEPVPVFFVGNKSDLVRIRQVPVADVEKLAHQQYAHGVFETSARTGNNVNALFQAVAESMLSTWGVPKASPPVFPFRDSINVTTGIS
ncbi:unnamed protein product [Schistocephalus solidus]|uniref:GTP-binding protein Rheb n=1 Tax=Schistocephalus solidus TaxID=70667 RepID=A0A183TKW9_SCHSO|nr:unnamed protein product [Schistocephalus solidus]